ncbi:MAG: GGDEF domain-containing protein [Pseudomonadaceae bacterium]|nr:GGDEF domain-containing protein [Pseudomonadaceae bacterium]
MTRSAMPAETTPDMQELAQRSTVDLRLVNAMAGEREMNAREQQMVDKLKSERGEGLFSDMLYTLTRRNFPSRQAKTLWADITGHRVNLKKLLGRDPGLSLAAHDYLTNVSGLMRNVGMIEEGKFNLLATVAVHDGLTGLYDKTTFAQMLKDELERALRYGRPLTLIMADIDHFKHLNDTYGHADGDVVLAQVADIIRKHCRSTDVAGRFGGEEFAVLLPESTPETGRIFAERVRVSVESHFADTPYKTTLSLGVAGAQTGDDATTLTKRADAALYEAKNGGRNRVCGGA